MTTHRFNVFAVAAELDLNRLGSRLGIVRKFRWEEPMVLDPETLRIISADRSEERQVYLYFFGGIVFINCDDGTIREFGLAMAKIADSFKGFPRLGYRDEYELRIDEGGKWTVTNDYALVPHCDRAFPEIIAFVLAKSVGLEQIEEQVDRVLDEVEGLIGQLEQGKLNIPDKRLAKFAARILNFKYRSIAYVMVLDKPEITWENPEADRLYLTMANMFELNQRYQEIKHKSETLMDITGVFSDLSHARRSSRLEWIIIILIFIEIVIYLFEMR